MSYETCRRCRCVIEHDAVAMGWPIPAPDGYIGPCCGEGHCLRCGDVVSATSEGQLCSSCTNLCAEEEYDRDPFIRPTITIDSEET